MSIIPRTKTQAAAFATVMAAIGAFVVVVAQAVAGLQCPGAPPIP